MNLQEIKTIVTEILTDKLGISETEINFESTMKDLGADSFDEVEIILELEHKFGISIPDDIIQEVQNIESLCIYIEKQITESKKTI
ncbi:MAG: acyl carrier protein [Bacteroidia bacterium]|nr:acyl carrier protein [Bacteroidia bacterium]